MGEVIALRDATRRGPLLLLASLGPVGPVGPFGLTPLGSCHVWAEEGWCL